MFSMFGSGSVRPRKIFRIWAAAVRFEPDFENVTARHLHQRPPLLLYRRSDHQLHSRSTQTGNGEWQGEHFAHVSFLSVKANTNCTSNVGSPSPVHTRSASPFAANALLSISAVSSTITVETKCNPSRIRLRPRRQTPFLTQPLPQFHTPLPHRHSAFRVLFRMIKQ
jgi:hypothetical protein